jgi:hypothetical protein
MAASQGSVISFGQTNDTTGFDIKLNNILLPKKLCNPFSTFRNRHNKAGFTPTGHHHLRIGDTVQHGVTRHSSRYVRAPVHGAMAGT